MSVLGDVLIEIGSQQVQLNPGWSPDGSEPGKVWIAPLGEWVTIDEARLLAEAINATAHTAETHGLAQ